MATIIEIKKRIVHSPEYKAWRKTKCEKDENRLWYLIYEIEENTGIENIVNLYVDDNNEFVFKPFIDLDGDTKANAYKREDEERFQKEMEQYFQKVDKIWEQYKNNKITSEEYYKKMPQSPEIKPQFTIKISKIHHKYKTTTTYHSLTKGLEKSFYKKNNKGFKMTKSIIKNSIPDLTNDEAEFFYQNLLYL